MDNLIKRKKAIEKHLGGVSLFDIMAELKVSERWFYKWLKRYRGIRMDYGMRNRVNDGKIEKIIAYPITGK